MKRVIGLCLLALMLILAPVGLAQEAAFDPANYIDEGGFFTEVMGIQTYVWARGPEDGPPVLLLHGFLGSAFDWRENIDALADAGFRVVAFDRPPFGLTDKPTKFDYTGAGQAAFVAAVMDVLGIERAALVGHSMGGRVAAQFALMHPERVTRLALVAGAITDEPAIPSGISTLLYLPGVGGLLTNAFSSAFDEMMTSGEIEPTMAERMRASFMAPGWGDAMVAYARAADGSRFMLAEIGDISAPTLLLWGAADRIVPLSVGEALHERLPAADWIVYDGIDHMPMQEAPEQFNRDLIAFLSEGV